MIMQEESRTPFSTKLRWITWALTTASLLMLGLWLYTQRREIGSIRWSQQGPIVLGLIAMYGFSAIVVFWIWHARNVAVSRLPWYRDMYLYAYSSLSRRLPSGLGYFMVRTARYPSQGLDGPTVIMLSFQELSLQIISGIGTLLLISLFAPGAIQPEYWFLAVSGLLFAILGHTPLLNRALARLSKGRFQFSQHLLAGKTWLWLLPYGLTWLNGGFMLYLLLSSISGGAPVKVWPTVLIWTFSGIVGLIGGLFPVGQIARDAVLSVLLARYMPVSIAILAALIFRLVLTIGDLVWSLILIAVSLLTQRRYCQSDESLP